MEKLHIFFLLCFGFLSVYNFMRNMEDNNRFGALETRQQGKRYLLIQRVRFKMCTCIFCSFLTNYKTIPVFYSRKKNQLFFATYNFRAVQLCN